MNDTAEIAVDVRDADQALRRFHCVAANFSRYSMTTNSLRFWVHRVVARRRFLRMIAGFEDVTEGGIYLFGDEIKTCRPTSVR